MASPDGAATGVSMTTRVISRAVPGDSGRRPDGSTNKSGSSRRSLLVAIRMALPSVR